MADVGGRRMMCSIPERFQLHLAMLALQFGYAGFHVVSRAALNMGMSKIVFPVYRNILALFLLLPFAYFLEKKERPPITLNFIIQFFLLAIVGIEKSGSTSSISLGGGGIGFTYAPNIGRRQWEKLDIGLHIFNWPLPVVKYPARLSFTSYQCFFGVLQFLLIAAFLERDPQAWLVHSGAELFSVFYAGVVASGIAFAVQIWCIDKGGPVSVAVYQPVQTLVVAIMASVALGEQFYLGGIIGAILIIIGLYLVLWGKNEERKFIAAEKAVIQSPADHGSNVTTPNIKSSITQPLLTRSTENV
ncbi:hypothetical protein ACJIZ3_024862 [Penstemon smallii]|uniref:WAT1-related protein n=1 Tax=Penstemon smallii TaxID=265156 RepID=A0ABD3TUQ9_9LAMI